ncbi:MAG TPA: hypothetical protein VFO60_02515 [Candidatus Dormibacteraeota bacterium]|nr:hypothetical protein [Candidatus Dormibacteraeota bacterium]
MVDGAVTLAATFLASLVESVEALTIVLAVGLTGGWQAAMRGTVAALGVLAVISALAPLLLDRVPERTLLGVVGVLILLFGARWLRKAILRAAGVVALHDEEAAFDRTAAAVSARGDWRAASVAFNGVLLEGVEVLFIVVGAASGGHQVGPAIAGAVAAAAVVAAAGAILRTPLSRVPENVLKLGVGVMLCSLGTFWAVEAMGYSWPLDAGSVPLLVALFAAASLGAAGLLRGGPGPEPVTR